MIQKLHLIAQELPSGKYVTLYSVSDVKWNVFNFVNILETSFFILCICYRFEEAKAKIAEKYDETECSLIIEFVKAHRAGDKDRMKEIASTLSHFKGYSQCIDAFIEEAQHVSMMTSLHMD